MALLQIWTVLATLLGLARASPHMMSEADMHQLNMINMPPGFSQKYLNFDPCLSSPCMFGRICKTISEQEVSSGFVCLNEIDATKEISDARMVYRNMELLAKEAILLNVATIQNHGQPPLSSSQQQALMMQQQQGGSAAHPQEQTVMMSFKGKKPVKMTCDQKPCQNDEICVSKPESLDGYICILQRTTVVEDENNKIIAKLLNDEKFMSESAARCQSSQESVHRRLEIPNLSTHFIACDDHEKSKFSIQSCPEGLLFNKFLDRCDLDQEPLTGGCSSSPCQFGGKCHDLSNQDYQCECPVGFTGKNCQQAPDVCATSPCGHSPGNICHVLPPESGLNFYCTCFSGKAFGLSCDEGKVERNPCEDGVQLGSVFSTRLSPSVFGLCDQDHRLNLRVCDRQMQAMGKCKWLSGLATSRSRRGTRQAWRKPVLKAKYE